MAQEQITRTAAAVTAFADVLEATVARESKPEPGSAGALGASLARLCRAFARHWIAVSEVIPDQVTEFNRDVLLLRTVLDEYATYGNL